MLFTFSLIDNISKNLFFSCSRYSSLESYPAPVIPSWPEYFLIYNEEFIIYFLNKIKNVEYFQNFFSLFPKGILVALYDKNSLLIAKKYKELLLKTYFYPLNFIKDFIEILDILSKSNTNCVEFLHFIEKTIDRKIINQIYLDIINSNIKVDINEFICNSIIDYLLNNNNSKNFKNSQRLAMIMFFLEKTCDNDMYVKSLINHLSQYYLRPENFLNEENSNNFKIYKILYQKNFFTRNLDWFINDSYYIRTVNSIEKILNLLEKLDIDYSTLFFLFDHYKDNLKENIISLCFGRLENANIIYHKLNNIKSEIFEKKNKFFKIFFS